MGPLIDMGGKRKTRFRFFLNPYPDMACTRCPKCEAKTKQRKLPLVIHIEPQTLCVLNKTCRFCPSCELVIARRSQIDPILTEMFDQQADEINRGEYLCVGTLDRADWREGNRQRLSVSQAVGRVWEFKDHLQFEVRGGWGRSTDPRL